MKDARRPLSRVANGLRFADPFFVASRWPRPGRAKVSEIPQQALDIISRPAAHQDFRTALVPNGLKEKAIKPDTRSFVLGRAPFDFIYPLKFKASRTLELHAHHCTNAALCSLRRLRKSFDRSRRSRAALFWWEWVPNIGES